MHGALSKWGTLTMTSRSSLSQIDNFLNHEKAVKSRFVIQKTSAGKELGKLVIGGKAKAAP